MPPCMGANHRLVLQPEGEDKATHQNLDNYIGIQKYNFVDLMFWNPTELHWYKTTPLYLTRTPLFWNPTELHWYKTNMDHAFLKIEFWNPTELHWYKTY